MVVRLPVGDDIVLDMLPNPLARRSSIALRSLDDIEAREGLVPGTGGRWRLTNLRIGQHPIPDLEATLSPTVTRLHVDGVLGLDFFARFAGVRWEPRTHPVTLIGPEHPVNPEPRPFPARSLGGADVMPDAAAAISPTTRSAPAPP